MIINGNLNSILKKSIVGLMNSNFARYYLFMIISSWGIEREQLNSDEFDQLPFIFTNNSSKLTNVLDEIISIKKSDAFNKEISHLEKRNRSNYL